ncbi:hypothetical protein ACJX0J_013578, partial [Zea mays]
MDLNLIKGDMIIDIKKKGLIMKIDFEKEVMKTKNFPDRWIDMVNLKPKINPLLSSSLVHSLSIYNMGANFFWKITSLLFSLLPFSAEMFSSFCFQVYYLIDKIVVWIVKIWILLVSNVILIIEVAPEVSGASGGHFTLKYQFCEDGVNILGSKVFLGDICLRLLLSTIYGT